MENRYMSDLEEFVCTIPNQLKVVFTESLVRDIYNTLHREEADMLIIDLLRYFIYGDDPHSVWNGETQLMFDLVKEKVGCFGRALGEGEEDV